MRNAACRRLGRGRRIRAAHSYLDQSLVDAPDIYFEAGDHQALIHVSGSEFLKLMANAPRGQISHHA
jgi:prolyl-tRNA editing enzyme YbaK/EbsC (Cys-tRNA(Pro) deacylase)